MPRPSATRVEARWTAAGLRDDTTVRVALPFDALRVALPSDALRVALLPDAVRVAPAATAPEPQPQPPPKRRAEPMSEPRSNGQQPDGQAEAAPGIEELIAEAEGLRRALQEAAARAGRLLAALKQQRRQTKAVEAAVATLRQLRLGG